MNWAFQSINEGSLLKLRHSLCYSSKKENIDEIGKNFVKYLSHLFAFFIVRIISNQRKEQKSL